MGTSQNVNDLSDHLSRATKPTSVSVNYEALTEYDKVNAELSGSQPGLVIDTRDPEIIQTLPDKFNSMIGESIDIESNHPRELISLLGEKLGINDYQRNLATFWLLDAIALQVIRNRHKLDPVNLAILISWISGEAKFIQERRFSRTEFFRKMGFIFSKASDLLDKGQSLMYWEEIIGIESSPKNQQEFQDDGRREMNASSRPSSKPGILNEFGGHADFQVAAEAYDIIQEADRRHSLDASRKSNPLLVTSMDVLEVIVESTYDVYANAFHYESANTAFVKGIRFRSYQLPYTLRYPRSVQLPVLTPAKIETPNEGARGKARSKTDQGKSGKSKGKEGSQSKLSVQVPVPPPSMTEEEMMTQKRKHILPLMESIEAPDILDQFAQSSKIVPISAEAKSDSKGKRKT